MNANEVIAYRAHVMQGGSLNDEKKLHPNDDVITNLNHQTILIQLRCTLRHTSKWWKLLFPEWKIA